MAGLLWYRSYMDSLANTSGYYPDIHAGHADRVTELTLEAPYLVRETPAGYNQLELSQIIGGTVAWNQLVQNGNFVDTSIWNNYPGTQYVSDNVLTRIGTSDGAFSFTLSQPASFIAGHKVLIAVGFKCSSANQMRTRYPFVSNALN